jgi:beta-glucosidase
MTTTEDRAIDREVDDMIATMTPREKVAQLVGLWMGASTTEDGIVAPLQDEMGEQTQDFADFAAHGLGQLTRVFGTTAIEPADGRAGLARTQSWLQSNTRLGIKALVHEECLTGLTAWRATAFPGPLSWGASFDLEAITEMARMIGSSMAVLGIHQGLAPVLDVVRDMRWGRVEETIGEDPYLVGKMGSAYIRGLQSVGIVATAKHFIGYSASVAGRNHAPVHAGPREMNDIFAVPFEMAVREAGVRSVMHSYTETDGVPSAADARLLTGLLRDRWGFTGTVVADYFGVSFLHSMHRIAADLSDAARLALAAGVDVELPTGRAFLDLVAQGAAELPIPHVDRALRRVLLQKAELGLLPSADGDAVERPAVADGSIDLDPPEYRAMAKRIAEESVILLANDGLLPLIQAPRTVAVIGPNGDSPWPLQGTYHFPAHVVPGADDLGIAVPTVAEATRAEWPDARVDVIAGATVSGQEAPDIQGAVAAARDADLALVVLGDLPGLFGRGTVGEGCDVADLQLPGRQRELAEAVLDAGTPTVLIVLSGRGYALDWAVGRAGAIVQAFTAGEEGSSAILAVLSGRVNPSGHLTVSMPTSAGVVPTSYLQPRLGEGSGVSTLDPAPLFPFGHGLSYTTFDHSLSAPPESGTGDWLDLEVVVANTGERAGADVVQVYGHDPVATVTRPTRQLLAFARVDLDPGERVRVRFRVPPARFAFSGLDLRRIVEPGQFEVWVGDHCLDDADRRTITLTGPVAEVGDDAPLSGLTTITRL